LKRVFCAPTITEAHLIKGVLENEGIESIIKNEPLSGLVVAVEAWPEVWVTDDAKAVQAEAVIHEFQSQLPEPEPPDEAS
jgi:hypothetical protein